jgi:prepilin-type N-terminal cleavage/methylation domain-containing protein
MMQKWKRNTNFLGFTLIELLLVISIIAILGVVVASVGLRFTASNNLENKVNEIISSLRTAQINAMIGKEDSNWGVIVSGDEIVLFAGNSFSDLGRDTTYDQSFSIPGSISISSFEVVFTKPGGTPSSTQVISISSEVGESATVSVNEVGIINLD